MHDEIKKFSLEGQISDSNVVQNKQRLVEYMENMMRDYGFVPSLDLEPQFTLDWSAETEVFNFTLTVYAVRTEKEKVWDTGGIMNGKPIMKHIPKNKSQQSLSIAD